MRQRDRISAVVGVGALGLAVFAIGGAPRWSVVLLALLAAGGVAAQLRSRRRFDRRSPLLALIALALALTAVQCIPLPTAVLSILNPTAHELLVDGARLAGEGEPLLHPLSLDPANTRRAVLELATYLALAWLALRFTATEQGRRSLAAAVVVVTSAAALVGLLHELGQATRLYGLYTPQHAGRPLIMGPILNPNSYGGLLAMGAVLAGGLALHGQQTARQRLFWGGLGVLSLAVCLLTQSRGAAVALVFGIAVFTGVIALQRWRARDRRRKPAELLRVTLPATLVVLSVLALVVYSSASGVTEQLGNTTPDEIEKPLSKYAAWRSTGILIEESPWVGVGRGGFESSFTRVHPESGYNTFSHVENAYLQAVVDWGVPGALAIALALAWLILLVARRASGGPLAAGAIGALAAIALHSTVDLGLELPGVAVPVIAIAALVTFVPVVEMSSRTRRRHLVLRAAAVAGLVVLALLVALPFGRTLSDDHDELLALSSPSLPEARRLMLRHPMDYVAPAEAARALLRSGRTAEGTEMLNHALMLHPTHPDLHLWVARALLLAGKPRQAQMEYVMAVRGRRNPTSFVKEIAAAYKAPTDVAYALPIDDTNAARIADVLVDLERNDAAVAYLRRVSEHNPFDARVQELLAKVATDADDIELAEQAARRRAALTPTLSARLALARLLYARGKLTDAGAVLRDVARAGGSVDDQMSARLLLCDVHQGLKDFPKARECLQALLEVPGLRVRTRRDIHRKLAKIEEELGNPRRAAWELREAER